MSVNFLTLMVVTIKCFPAGVHFCAALRYRPGRLFAVSFICGCKLWSQSDLLLLYTPICKCRLRNVAQSERYLMCR